MARAALKYKRIVPLEEVENKPYYEDMADLARIFQHDIIEDEGGTFRWKPNLFVCRISDHAPVYTPSKVMCDKMGIMPYCRPHTQEFRASLDLNQLWMDFGQNEFSVEQFMKYYMQIGYSLSGYAEVFGQKQASEFLLEGAIERNRDEDGEEEDEGGEDIIQYVCRRYKGQTLKL